MGPVSRHGTYSHHTFDERRDIMDHQEVEQYPHNLRLELIIRFIDEIDEQRQRAGRGSLHGQLCWTAG
jgi:hypothetical protein